MSVAALSVALPLLAAGIDDQIAIAGVGIIITIEATCSLVALDDGRVYAIDIGQPPMARLTPGTRVRIEGVPVRASNCRKGQSLSLRRIEVLIEHDETSR